MNKLRILILLFILLTVFVFVVSCDGENKDNSKIVEKDENSEENEVREDILDIDLTEKLNEKDTEKDTEEEKTKLVVYLTWIPQAQFAGFYTAKDKGFYEDEGLDVELNPGGVGMSAVDKLLEGKSDIGVSWFSRLPQVKVESNNTKLINIAQLFQKSGLLLISKKDDGITKPSDLENKKVGYWTGDYAIQLNALLRREGVKNVELVPQGFTMEDFIGNKIDVVSAMIYNEYNVLLNKGLTDDDLYIIEYGKYGLNFPEDCIFVREDKLEEKREAFEKFLKASLKGWYYSFENKEEAIDILMKNDAKDRDHQTYMLDRIEELMLAGDGKEKGFGYIDFDSLQNVIDTMKTSGILKDESISAKDICNDTLWKNIIDDVKK